MDQKVKDILNQKLTVIDEERQHLEGVIKATTEEIDMLRKEKTDSLREAGQGDRDREEAYRKCGEIEKEILDMLNDVVSLSKSVREAPIRENERSVLIEAVRTHERSRILLQEEKRRLRDLEGQIESHESRIDELRSEMSELVGSVDGKSGLERRLEATRGAIPRARSLLSESMENTRKELEISSSEKLRKITGRGDLEIRIHEKMFTMGRKEKGKERIIPLSRLSAGERESFILSVIVGISEISGSGVILDSPFTGMEAGSVDRCVGMLSNSVNCAMILVPEGTLSDIPGSAARYLLDASQNDNNLEEG